MKTRQPDVKHFVDQMALLDFEAVFNPYAQSCAEYDGEDAPSVRRQNLAVILEAALAGGIDSLWIGRDLGYRGGRRTGLALTDEVHLDAHARLFGVPPLARSTRGPAVSERTATVIWRALAQVNRPIFLWNVFPLHPHKPEDPMSNRCHTRAERQACRPLLMWLIEKLRPRSILAIGRDAQLSLADLEIEALEVRHPSYGGQTAFLDGVRHHYGVARVAELAQPRLF